MVDILIGVLLLGIGGAAGWVLGRAYERTLHRQAAQTATEKELQRLQEEKEAFDLLLNYNINTAYGLDKKE